MFGLFPGRDILYGSASSTTLGVESVLCYTHGPCRAGFPVGWLHQSAVLPASLSGEREALMQYSFNFTFLISKKIESFFVFTCSLGAFLKCLFKSQPFILWVVCLLKKSFLWEFFGLAVSPCMYS